MIPIQRISARQSTDIRSTATDENSEKQYLQKWRRLFRCWLEQIVFPDKLIKNKTYQYDLIKIPIDDEIFDEWYLVFIRLLRKFTLNVTSKFPNLHTKDELAIEKILKMLEQRELKKVQSDRSELFSVRFNFYFMKLTDNDYKTNLFQQACMIQLMRANSLSQK